MTVSCVTYSAGVIENITIHFIWKSTCSILNSKAHHQFPCVTYIAFSALRACGTQKQKITHTIRTYLYSCYTKPEPIFSNVIIINITYIYHRNSEYHKNVPFYQLFCMPSHTRPRYSCSTKRKWPQSYSVWLPHLLTAVGLTQEVRAISSVISAVRCRWCMFLSCPF